jgi:leucyl aminopeptidase (aminopeptidase T)
MAKLKTVTINEQKLIERNKLENAARIAMSDVLGLKEGEEVLIITNFEGEVFPISHALFNATRKLGGKPVMIVQEQKRQLDMADRLMLEAAKAEPDIVIPLSSLFLGKDPYGTQIGYMGHDGKKYESIFYKLEMGDRRIRSFGGGMLTVDMFERCVPIDYKKLRDTAQKLIKILTNGSIVRLTSPAGTNATISIKGRHCKADDGNLNAPGKGGNLPAGEAFISPTIEGVSGTLVFDGTITLDNSDIIPQKPVKITMKDGYVNQVTGGAEAKMLLNVIKKAEVMARAKGLKDKERNSRHIGELGIGLNPAAKMTGNIMEDEKVLRTVHLAIGSNYDLDANALIHLDCLMINPTMWVDEKQIMKDGALLL